MSQDNTMYIKQEQVQQARPTYNRQEQCTTACSNIVEQVRGTHNKHSVLQEEHRMTVR